MGTEILKKMRLTEKANLLSSGLNKYVFEVCGCANKHQIALAIVEQFGVKVQDVNVLNQRGKAKLIRSSKARHFTMTSRVKKAIVTLAAGEKIEIA